jgi:MuDR family transposase
MSYADEPYFRKPSRIDEQFGVGQQFSTKSELKVKIADFHVQRNIKLEITNSSKSKLVMKCKDSNCPWRMYATPNITSIWEIKINPLEHSYFGSATRADQSQMTSRMIADIVKNRLRDNLEITVKKARGLVKQKFPKVLSGSRQLFIYAIVENTWHKCVEWFYKRREIAAAWEAQGMVFSQNVTELIKHRGDKGRTYDVIPLDWDINNYDVYNRNRLIETVIFDTYIIFYLTTKFKQ